MQVRNRFGFRFLYKHYRISGPGDHSVPTRNAIGCSLGISKRWIIFFKLRNSRRSVAEIPFVSWKSACGPDTFPQPRTTSSGHYCVPSRRFNFSGGIKKKCLETRSSGSLRWVANGIHPGLLPVVVSREKLLGCRRESRRSKYSFSFEIYRKICRDRHVNYRGSFERFAMDGWESILSVP